MSDMNSTNASETEVVDPFDPARLRLAEVAQLGVKKVPTVIACDKPNRQQFVRVRPDADFRMETAIFQDKLRGENYLVDPVLWESLAGDIVPTYLFASITRTNNVFLWPVRIPDPDGRQNNWHLSQLKAAELAMKAWVRMSANMADGKYDVFEATGNIPEPEWPEFQYRSCVSCVYRPLLGCNESDQR